MLVGISNKQGWEFCHGGLGSPSAQELSPPKPLSADVTGEFSKSRIWSSCFIFKVLKRRNDNLLYICLLLCGSCWENRKPSGWLMVPWTHRSHSPHPHLCFCWTLLEACSPSRTVLGERASGHHHPGSVFSQVHGRSQLLLGLPGPLIICLTLTTWLSLSALDNHLS